MKPGNLSRLSIRQRLSLLISLLVLSVILIFGLISYIGVKRAALQVGRDRVMTLTDHLATMFSTSMATSSATIQTACNKLAIKKFLLTNGKDSSKEAMTILEDLLKDTLNTQAVLLNATNIPVLNATKKEIELKVRPDYISSLIATNRADSPRVGKLYAIKDSIYYPVVAAVTDKNKIIGHLIRWRILNTTQKALDQFSQLMGTDAKLFLGNNDGTLWTDLRKSVSAPPISDKSDKKINEYSRTGNQPVIASIRPIAKTNWLLAVELSKRRIMEAANKFLYWLLAAGIILLVIGFLVTWQMSRSISGPLRKLTAATSAIAAGDFSSSVFTSRYDELGKLARAFNAMSKQVQHSQMELETKAKHYRLLFEHNPMPMWIISETSSRIMDVNESAVIHYDYSKEEFLELKEEDLRAEEKEKNHSDLNGINISSRPGIMRHKLKDGSVIIVDVIEDQIFYKDERAKILLAHDVTQKVKAEEELANHRLSQQKIITETALQAQEKEREEIGKELHDNINQMLAAAKLYIEIARENSHDIIRDPLFKSYETIKLAMGEIRHLSKQLVPPPTEISLIETINQLIDELQEITTINFSFIHEKLNEKVLNSKVKLMIYRVVQEQFNNIVKHSQASRVNVKVSTDYENIFLSIEDNGVGFNVRTKTKGIGLRNIDNRVKFYNGTATFTSAIGAGCRLEIHIPPERTLNKIPDQQI